MNNSAVENSLPSGWTWTTLGEVVELRYGKGLIEAMRDSNGKIPVYGSNGIVGYHSSALIDQPCLVVGRKGAAGEVHMSSGPCWPIDTTYYVIPPQGLSLSFVFYLLGTLRLSGLDKSTAIPGLNRNDAYSLIIPLPPLAEQKRIVAKIEELFSKLDAGIKALSIIKAELKRYRQSVLKHAFEGKLTEEWRKQNGGGQTATELLEQIRDERRKLLGAKYKDTEPIDTSDLPELPKSWAWARVSDIGNVHTGTTPSKTQKEYYSDAYPFYKPTDLNAGYYTKDSEDGLSKKGIEEARLLPEKSILVTCIGATIGKTGLNRKTGATNQQINAIVPSKSVVPEFVYWDCVSEQFQKYIKDNASATTLPILNKRKFELLPMPIAPLPEQQAIVSEIERHFSIADEVEKVVDHSLQQAERLRQSILKRAFEGKLVEQDPSDEPAEMLLERIKAEREKQKTKNEVKPTLKKLQRKTAIHGRRTAKTSS